MKEAAVMHRILLDVGCKPNTLFRQNVGSAWAGEATQAKRTMQVTLQPGDVVVRQGRPVRMGLCEGSSDIIGWRSVVIQPEDVGRRLAVFAALEVKTETGRVRPKQAEFIDLVQRDGGIAGVVRGVDDAKKVLAGT